MKKKKHALEALEEQRMKHPDESAWLDVKNWTATRLKAIAAHIAEKGGQTALQKGGPAAMLQKYLDVKDSADWAPLTESELKAASDPDSNPAAPEAGAEDYTAAAAGSGALPLESAEDKRRAIAARFEKTRREMEAEMEAELAALGGSGGWAVRTSTNFTSKFPKVYRHVCI